MRWKISSLHCFQDDFRNKLLFTFIDFLKIVFWSIVLWLLHCTSSRFTNRPPARNIFWIFLSYITYKMIRKPVHFYSIPLLSLYMQITIFILQLKLEEGGGAQALSPPPLINSIRLIAPLMPINWPKYLPVIFGQILGLIIYWGSPPLFIRGV